MKRLLLLLIPTLAIGGVALWIGLHASQPVLTISSSLINFGDIDQDGGVVSMTVEVSNTGNRALEINRISTSCGCTTATMDETPLAPGEKRTLTIQFDPMTHPDQSGLITRVVYIQSSDPNQSEVEIDVIGNVIPKMDV